MRDRLDRDANGLVGVRYTFCSLHGSGFPHWCSCHPTPRFGRRACERRGLVAADPFDEGTGTTVVDLSGNGNNGTIASAAWTTAGKYGNALVFNGTNAVVTINDSASLKLTAAMTLEAWVNPSAGSSAWRDVIYKGNDNYYLEGSSSSGGVIAVGGTFAAGASATLYGSAALPTNVWSHIAATYDGAALRLYLKRHTCFEPGTDRGDRDVDQSSADRRRQPLRAVLPGSNRRGANLQPRSGAGRNPGGHERAARKPPLTRRRRRRRRRWWRPPWQQRHQSELDRLDRQRGGDRVSGRALPGRGLQQLCAGWDADRDNVRRHRSAGGHQLQLPGARDRRGRQSERVLERGQRDHGSRRPTRRRRRRRRRLVATANAQHRHQSELDRVDRQRGGDRLSGRALPGRGLQQLRAGRDRRPRPRSATPGCWQAPATATGCGRPTPPAI